jgi:hypothetical protein
MQKVEKEKEKEKVSGERKRYQGPTLIQFGSVTELTKGQATGPGSDHGMNTMGS